MKNQNNLKKISPLGVRATVATGLFFLLIFSNSFAQNRINLTVRLKPESVKKVTDLGNTKALTVSLQNPQNFPMTVIVRSSLTNTNGLNIQNRSTFKPSNGIVVPANGNYTLSNADLSEIFDTNNLLIRIGDLNADLPPSDYTLCLKVIDFLRPTTTWADDNCTRFTINAPIKVETTTVPSRGRDNSNSNPNPIPTEIPAPNLIRPTRDDEIKVRDKQNVLFTWASASGTPAGTKFTFRIVEYPSETQRAIEVFEKSKNDYEETTSSNLLTLGSRDFELKPNTKYLWAVTAFLPDTRLKTRSEIRVFTYKTEEEKSTRREEEKPKREEEKKRPDPEKEVIIAKKEPEKQKDNKTPSLPKDIKYPKKPLSEYKVEVGNLNPFTTFVKGKLLYAYPEDYSMEKGKVAKSNYSTKEGKGTVNFLSLKEYSTFSYLNPISQAKPMPKTKINLVMVHAILKENISAPTYKLDDNWRLLTTTYQSDLLDYTFNGQKITETSRVLATTTTNEKGEFTFNFIQKDTCQYAEFKIKAKDKVIHFTDEKGNYKEITETGSTVNKALIMRTFMIVVESPYYCSPVMFINPKSGENISLPDQVSLVKSFELTLRTIGDDKLAQTVKTASNAGEAEKAARIENINIELFRMKPTTVNLPSNEGQNLPQNAIQSMKMGDYAAQYPIDKVDRVVALGKTNSEGEFKIPRVVRIGNPNDVFVAHSYTSISTGVYNYYDGIKSINAFGTNSGEVGSGFDGDFDKFLRFNTTYEYEKENFNLFMNPKKPKILGKTVENGLPLPNVNVILKTKVTTTYEKKVLGLEVFSETKTEFKPVDSRITDKDGYFEFLDLPVGDYQLEFWKDGYKAKSFKKEGENKQLDPNSILTIQMGTLMQLNEVSMIPSGKVFVCVDDEEKKRVVADLRIDDGPMYVTEKSSFLKGCIYIPAAAGKNRTLKVYPRSDEYFNEEYKIDVEDGGTTNIKGGTIIVYKRKHRMRFTVNGKQGNNSMPLEGVKVEVVSQKLAAFTDGNGVAEIVFESPGKNFLVKITPQKGANWTYVEKEYNNIPTKKSYNYFVNLSPAKEIMANVLDKDGKPLKNAQVYIKQIKDFWNAQNGNYVECTTDDNGNCKLQGIPVNENNIEVFATKNNTDGITYIGEKKEAFWFNGQFQTKVDFKLQTQEGFVLKDIWGFPVQIEEAKPLDANTFEVSGALVNPPFTADFSLLEKDFRLDFKKIKVSKSQIGENTHQPQSDFIKTNQSLIPLRIGSKFQGKANTTTQNNGLTNDKITLKKGQDGKGEIYSPVVLELASFEGAYQLKGKIEMGESVNSPNVLIFKALQQNITQVGGKNINLTLLEKKKFLLGSNQNGKLQNLNYRIHNFEAEAVASKSYFYSDSVKLYSILHTNIPTMVPSDLALEAGYITILADKVRQFDGGNAISFNLEKWKVNGQKSNQNLVWEYDKNNGGIVIPKAIVNTGIFGVELKNLIIKPDKLIADKLELDNKDASSLSLGGFVPLEVTKGSTFKFSYDPNCYHDYKPHWKLSLLAGNGQTAAARINNLDGLEDNQKIEFGSMNLFSDNQQQFNEADQKTLVFKKVLNFNLTTIDVQNDNFTMLGTATMNIPNMSNNGGGIYGQIMYSKGSNGKAVFSFKPLNYGIEGKGQVSFKPFLDPKNQTLTSGKYVSNGTVTVYDSPSGKSFNLQAKLTHEKAGNPYNTFIEILDNQKVPLGSKFLSVKDGIVNSGMKVASSEWENLRLKTVIPTGQGGFEMLNDDESKRFMTLVVKGAIETDPSSGIVGLKGQDTGMGKISLFYDFKREEMRGNFFFEPPVPINFGLVNLTSSNVSMAVGTNGFFIMTNGTGDIALPGGLPLPVSGGVNFVAGYYTTQLPQEDINTIISLSVKKSLPSFMKNGIKGLYSSVNVNSQPFDKGFDYGIEDVASVSCFARAGVAFEYRSFINFIDFNKAELGSGMYAYGGVDMGGSAEILGIGVEGGVHIDVQASMESKVVPTVGLSVSNIKNSLQSINLNGCVSITGSFYIGACVLGECLGGTVSKSVSANFEIQGIKPSFDFRFDSCGNGLPVMKLTDSGY
jgi:hypothetical protein